MTANDYTGLPGNENITSGSLPERFLPKITFSDAGCWLWTGKVTSGGYGSVWWHGRQPCAHRVVYELMVGDIPQGLQLDHICRVRNCVNPAHLEPVTPQENTLRGQTLGAANSLKTHCPKGHPYDSENTYITRANTRACRECSREATRQWRQARSRKVATA